MGQRRRLEGSGSGQERGGGQLEAIHVMMVSIVDLFFYN